MGITHQDVVVDDTSTINANIWNKTHTVDAGGITIGTDVILFRGAANRLDLASGDNFRIVNGELQFGTDVNLYRSGANELRTNDGVIIGNADYNFVVSAGVARIQFGDRSSVWDTNLYRGGPNQLKTDDELNMNTHKIINVSDPTSAQDACTKSYADGIIGAEGWHGSASRIKIFPADMVPSTETTDYTLGTSRITSNAASQYFRANIPIPSGYKATHVMLYGNDATNVVYVYECWINNTSSTEKGNGNIDSEINITDVTSSTTNYLSIYWFGSTNDECHGGYVTITAA